MWGALTNLVKPIANVIQRRNDNATAIKTIQAKAAAASTQADASVTLSKAEWEMVGLKMSGGSWKDEWLCFVFTLPLFAGLLPGTEQVADNIVRYFGDGGYTQIMYIIVGASFGVRMWGGK